jgi:tetrahydromethanopterin S-methyltransferase subunit F
MLTTGLLLLASLLIAATIAQSPYNGAWTTYYGGNFFICVDPSGIMNGVYSEFGFVHGVVSGTSASGQWFQTGSYAADLNGDLTANRGTFSFNLPTDNRFSGSYMFEDTRRQGDTWTGNRISTTTPLDTQCWSPNSTLFNTLDGRWDTDTGFWDQCIGVNGAWTASYEYGNGIRGYVTGRCFLDGKFCHGDWFEPNQVNGGYMVRLMSENDMIGSWWQVNASDFDTSTYSTYSRDIGYHGVESRIRIGAAQNCARNADLFFDAGALSAGAIAGIVIGCVFGGALIVLIIICICCKPSWSTGSGGRRRVVLTTRRYGFGRSHRTYGGGYS